MRNLSLAETAITSLLNASVSATAIDLDENVLYVASERQNLDADLELEIWKFPLQNGGAAAIQEVSAPSVLTTFSVTASTVANPQIVSFQILPEMRQLGVILLGGDIITISLDEDNPEANVEGTVDQGIWAASWCPDDSLIALVTGESKLILMTSTFDILSEAPLHTSDFGEDAPINVGWGSKQTQFHGSLGKAAAQAPSVSAVGSSPDDDGMPRISWRGDGAFFVVSALSPDSNGPRHRTIRVYDRQAALQSTSEPVAGLEHPISWRPSGNLIVGTQIFGFEGGGMGREGRHDIVFFERNGLRHGEFGMRVGHLVGKNKVEGSGRKWGYKVRELSWSCDSNVLGVWIEGDEGDIVQLWTTGNYHWYLKQEISAPFSSPSQPGRFTSVSWHPEIALHLILTTKSEVIQRKYSWETFTSPSKFPNDSGSVAVIDGSSISLTPFRTQNIPPPMSSHQLALTSVQPSHTPIHASFSSTNDTLAIIWESGHSELWDLRTRIGPGRGKVMDPVITWEGFVHEDDDVESRQIIIWNTQVAGSAHVTILGSSRHGGDIVTIHELKERRVVSTHSIQLPKRNGRLVTSDEVIVWQAPDGELFHVNSGEGLASPIARFPEFCFLSERVSVTLSESIKDNSLYLGLSNTGKLYATGDQSTPARLLTSNATSFTVASGYAIFTTSAHEATFAPLSALFAFVTAPEIEGESKSPVGDWEKRRVERGSRIVVAVPSTMSLVLQMPRGNLETINPRPLVMEVVRQDLNAGDYRKAFFACRKHRIDLNVLVDHDQVTFLQRLTSFVEQVHEVDHINLFLTSLGRGSQAPETIAKLCDAIRVELERKDLTKYVNSILTAYVVKTPPDHEAGLALLLRLRDSDPHLVEDAVKYIIFLVDADRLFDTALGMYDFSLVLMIAQHAQKDPREYLPFLRELRALDKYYQRFRIDDHLRRHESALRNLSLAGPHRFEEAVAYVERHQLYEPALTIWKGTDRYNLVLGIYGDWLFERRDFRQAASVFIEADTPAKAMVAHEKSLEWQELFELAMRTNMPQEEITSMGYRVAEDLSSKKRYPEAARVLLDYSKDIREAVIALVHGNKFSEARRITTLYSAPEMVTDIIYPGALETRAQLSEDINEMRDQLQKQIRRIRELRIKKVEEPDSFYGVEDTNLHNVDVMTDISMPATTFTRYTVAPSTASRTSKRSSRSKRKMERKVGSGRKGTVDEEEYLLKSVTKLVVRFNTTQEEARNLLPYMSQFTAEHREEGLMLQADLTKFELEFKEALDEIWKKPVEAEGEDILEESWATRMEAAEKARLVNPAEKVVKPELGGHDWRLKLLDLATSSAALDGTQ